MDAKLFSGEPRVLISRDALLHNVAVVRRSLKPDTKLCAIVKADAYGHNAQIVVDTLCNFSNDQLEAPAVDAVAVACLDEASALPELPVPVLVLRPVENAFIGRQRSQLELAIRNGWILTIVSAAAANDVARIALAIQQRASVQIMIDTGMTRSGVDVDQLDRLVTTVQSHPSLKLVGLGTHFANGHNPGDAYTAEQLSRYCSATSKIIEKSSAKLVRHAASSGPIFFTPQAHFDMVRPGISLYGIDPSGKPSMERPLRPVLKWTAPLIGVRDVRKGTTVGYSQTWTAPRDTRIGLVPVGYADGYLRSFSNAAMMLLHGTAVPVVGRVSMDLVTLDLGHVPQATIGDEVVVLDDDPLSPASVYNLARIADSIPYEIFCRIGARVHRVAVGSTDTEEASWPIADSTSPEKSF